MGFPSDPKCTVAITDFDTWPESLIVTITKGLFWGNEKYAIATEWRTNCPSVGSAAKPFCQKCANKDPKKCAKCATPKKNHFLLNF